MDNLETNTGETKNNKNGDAEGTIFTELADASKYRQNVKNARYWLYLLAGYWLVYGVIYFYRMANQQTSLFIIVTYSATGIVFLTFALWSYKNSSQAFLISLLFYIALSLWLIYERPFNIQENIIRVLVVIVLVKGFRDAKKYEEVTKVLGNSDEHSI